jgi:hypothetical protein
VSRFQEMMESEF